MSEVIMNSADERAIIMDEALAIVERRLQRHLRTVTVTRHSGFSERRYRHLTVKKDIHGLYVRMGKRGSVKKYLRDMASARIVDTKLDLVVFHEF